MNARRVLAFILGAGLFAVALLMVAASVVVGIALGCADRLAGAFRWPLTVPGDLHG
jgi:hypothetical protein